MGLKDELGSITASIATGASAPVRSSHSGGKSARTAPGALFAFSEQSRQMERDLEELKRAAGTPRLVDRSAIRPSPYQTRTVTEKAVAELAANLKENDLATPVVVREIELGLFEMIAGHKRDAAFGLLGRTTIPAIVVTMTDEQAERAVFYDNFFPPDVCDYEKYLGLRQIQKRHDYTQEQLAERSGISRTLVAYLMAFERLPEAALKVLNKHPALLGATTAAKLAQVDDKYAPRIVEGLTQLAESRLRQAQLIDWVTGKTSIRKATPTVIKSGRSIYAKLLRRDARLVVEFATADDAAAVEKAVADLIKERASNKSAS